MTPKIAWFCAAVYLLVLGYYGLRPFQPIPGLVHHVHEGTGQDGRHERQAFEVRDLSGQLNEQLMGSGRLTVEVVLQTATLNQSGPACILVLGRDTVHRNFMLGQNGNGLEFRLRTTETDQGGMMPSLLVSGVFETNRLQHIVVTYDGSRVRLYVDGEARPEQVRLSGSFSNWDNKQLLTMGDEVAGWRPWYGTVDRFAIFDRALSAAEVKALHDGDDIGGSICSHDRSAGGGKSVRPLRYRNLFVFSDQEFDLLDCLANILGFVPVAAVTWVCIPERRRRRGVVMVVLIPFVIGMTISGTIELSQRYIAARVPSLLDLMYNGSGTLIGGLLLWYVLSCNLHRLRQRPLEPELK